MQTAGTRVEFVDRTALRGKDGEHTAERRDGLKPDRFLSNNNCTSYKAQARSWGGHAHGRPREMEIAETWANPASPAPYSVVGTHLRSGGMATRGKSALTDTRRVSPGRTPGLRVNPSASL